jgi:photosystem II stability/assembly factor-like uncharacterized protein
MPYKLFVVAALALSASACTFYTNTPDCGNGQPSGGTSNNGGSGNGGSGNNGGSMEPPLSEAEWENVTNELAGLESECGNLGFVSAKPNENVVIAGVAQQGLFSTRDGGDSWQKIGQGKDSAEFFNRPADIVWDPEEPARWWVAAIYGAGAFRTDDDGDTFTQLGDIIHMDSMSIDFTDPDRLTLLGGGHEATRTMRRSTDAGMTWESIGAELPATGNCTWPLILDATTYLVGCGGYGGGAKGIYRSDDGGESWTSVSETGGAIIPLRASSGRVFWPSDSSNGMARSLDGGATWETLESTKDVIATPTELPDGRIAVLIKDTVYVSKDEGETWRAATAKLPVMDARGVVYSGEAKAFFAWRNNCEAVVADDAVWRVSFDHEAL